MLITQPSIYNLEYFGKQSVAEIILASSGLTGGGAQGIFNSPGANELNRMAVYNEINSDTGIVFYKLNFEFEKMWSGMRQHFVGIPKFTVRHTYSEIHRFMLHLGLDSISFSLTSDASIHVTGRLEEKKIFVEVFFEEGSLGPIEVILNIFKGKECVLAYGGSLQAIFEKIEDFLSNYENPFSKTSWWDEISPKAIAQNELQDYFLAC